jgi:predicted nucleotidyltransferase
MNRREVQSRLAAHSEELRSMGVTSLALFGSTARNESSIESDVDLLVEFDRPVGLFHFFSVQHRLEEILGARKVDLVQRGALHPALREHILAEAIRVA